MLWHFLYSAAPLNQQHRWPMLPILIPAALPQEFDEFVSELPVWRTRTWLRLQFRLRRLSEHHMFDNIFLGFILLSTVLLALEYDGE
jgi:hypothetical protein